MEFEDSTLCIHFPDHREMILVRWIKAANPGSRCAMQVALIDDTEEPDKAQIVTGRYGAQYHPKPLHEL